MRILFAGDEHPYSAYALKKVIELAWHTWADVTLLGVSPAQPSSRDPMPEALHRYREEFMEALGGQDSPYAQQRWEYEWMALRNGSWEEVQVRRGIKKELRVRLRIGTADTEILNEALRDGSDLIVMGSSGAGKACTWNSAASTAPQKVIGNAACSVLLIKEDRPIKRVLACLDQTTASQESIEMINQILTIHGAQLELIGLTKDGGAKPEAYTQLIRLGDYFGDRGIPIHTRLAEQSKFESVLSTHTGDDLLALWMGKKSLLTLLFPRDWVEKFASACPSSVLVLR